MNKKKTKGNLRDLRKAKEFLFSGKGTDITREEMSAGENGRKITKHFMRDLDLVRGEIHTDDKHLATPDLDVNIDIASKEDSLSALIEGKPEA